jgi:hypothetical protein
MGEDVHGKQILLPERTVFSGAVKRENAQRSAAIGDADLKRVIDVPVTLALPVDRRGKTLFIREQP